MSAFCLISLRIDFPHRDIFPRAPRGKRSGRDTLHILPCPDSSLYPDNPRIILPTLRSRFLYRLSRAFSAAFLLGSHCSLTSNIRVFGNRHSLNTRGHCDKAPGLLEITWPRDIFLALFQGALFHITFLSVPAPGMEAPPGPGREPTKRSLLSQSPRGSPLHSPLRQ